MAEALKYIIDESGHKTSVLVPLKVWEALNTNYVGLQKKLDIFKSIQLGLKEVKQASKTGRQLQTLKDFLG
jgi:hypothetical protein